MLGCLPRSGLMTGRHLTRLMDPCITMLRQPKNIAPNPYQLQPASSESRLCVSLSLKVTAVKTNKPTFESTTIMSRQIMIFVF